MALFQNFKGATGSSKTPEFLRAEIERAKFEQAEKQKKVANRNQNILGAASLYNAGMGDRSPIADYVFGQEGADIDPLVAQETGTITPAGSETAESLRSGLGSPIDQTLANSSGTITPLAGETAGAAVGGETAGVLAGDALATEAIASELAGTAAGTAAGGGTAATGATGAATAGGSAGASALGTLGAAVPYAAIAAALIQLLSQ